MRTRILVLEDRGDRTQNLTRAVKNLAESPTDPQVDLDIETHVARMVDFEHGKDENFRSYPLEDLALYDAFLIDFSLGTERLRQYGGGTFDLASADGTTRMVTVTTGMGAMLYLRQVLESPEYQGKREALAPGRPPARMFSFVETHEIPSMFFASAAYEWFGADLFHADPNAAAARALLLELIEVTRGDRGEMSDRYATPVREAGVSTFRGLMEIRIARGISTHFAWNIRQDNAGPPRYVLDEMYDWLAVYLDSGGKRGGLPGLREAGRRFGVEIPWHQTHQYDSRALEMQNALAGFLDSYPTKPLIAGFTDTDQWPDKWRTSEPDPLHEVLTASSLFWTAEDVREALREHRARAKRDIETL